MFKFLVVTFSILSIIWSVIIWRYDPYYAATIILFCALVGALFTKRVSEVEEVADVYFLSIFLSTICGGVPYLFLELFTFTYYTDYVRSIRYRGYLFPTKKNKLIHMGKILSGELQNDVPPNFR